MTKRIILVCMVIAICLGLCACGNKTLIDTTFTFNEAIVELADGTIVRGQVQTWRDFADGDQIQVKIDGVTYLVHSANCTLIAR